jgi:hypothetical protein
VSTASDGAIDNALLAAFQQIRCCDTAVAAIDYDHFNHSHAVAATEIQEPSANPFGFLVDPDFRHCNYILP